MTHAILLFSMVRLSCILTAMVAYRRDCVNLVNVLLTVKITIFLTVNGCDNGNSG